MKTTKIAQKNHIDNFLKNANLSHVSLAQKNHIDKFVISMMKK
jgi:hypothetical protein